MEKTLKVLSIGSDTKLFEDGSAVSERIKEYGNLVEELHIVVFSDFKHSLKNKQLSPNVWIYPTNSISRFMRPVDAARLGKQIVFDRKFVRGRSIITAQDPFESGWAALKVKKHWRLPLEVQIHTNPFSPEFKGFENTVRKFFMKGILKSSDSIRTVDKDVAGKLTAHFSLDSGKIFVLPIYVDKKRIQESMVSFDLHARYGWQFIMLSVSRLTPEKNLSKAIEVLAIVRSRFPRAGMVIVGSGPEEARLKALAKKLQVEDAIDFVGWQEDPTSFYKTANVFIQTSVYEGYGLSLVEAGLSGLPVVTTPVGIAKELENGKDAYIYTPERTDLFAGAVMELIENTNKRINMSTNIKHTLESKLVSKEEYLSLLKKRWQDTASRIAQ